MAPNSIEGNSYPQEKQKGSKNFWLATLDADWALVNQSEIVCKAPVKAGEIRQTREVRKLQSKGSWPKVRKKGEYLCPLENFLRAPVLTAAYCDRC